MNASAVSSISVRPTLTFEDVQSVMLTVSKCLARLGFGRMQIVGRPQHRPGWRPLGFSAVCRFDGDVRGVMALDLDRAMVDAVARRTARGVREISDTDRLGALEIVADLVVTDAIRRTNHHNRLLAPDSVDLHLPGCWDDIPLDQFPMAVTPVLATCGECRLAYSFSPDRRSMAGGIVEHA